MFTYSKCIDIDDLRLNCPNHNTALLSKNAGTVFPGFVPYEGFCAVVQLSLHDEEIVGSSRVRVSVCLEY